MTAGPHPLRDGDAVADRQGAAKSEGTGIWVLVLVEAMTFAAYSVIYTINYRWYAPEFLAGQTHLSRGFGVLETVVLLTSSWSVARCVAAARAGARELALVFAWATIAFGLLFCCAKIYEWYLKIASGLTFSTSGFFSFYYFLTAMHLLHVLVGFVFLGVVIYQLRSARRASLPVVETGAIFWHMVDFLWVVIFALLYIMR